MGTNEGDRDGRTPLHRVFTEEPLEGHAAAVRDLVARGADPDRQDRNGWTALHFAAQARSVAGAEALIAAGAGPDLTDAHGNGPLVRAIFASEGETGVVRLLLAAGADPDRPNAAGITARALAHRIADFDASLLPEPPEG